jgi:acetoin utilization deacetylase AcuC-like enzyme
MSPTVIDHSAITQTKNNIASYIQGVPMKVFYRPEQVATSYQPSPSALKPKLVVADWLADPLINAEICSYEPVSSKTLKLAHDPRYVRGVLSGSIENGFGNRDIEVGASLPFTTGSMVAAAEYAVLHREAVSSPTSGFHHAEYAGAMGYCTFNGLMVAALALKEAGLVNQIGIIDCDAHYGKGTDNIIRQLNINWIEHHTLGKHFSNPGDAEGGRFESWLKRAIKNCKDCDLVLYQAGADAHIDDPLGGFLTLEQMSWRDRKVFEGLGHLPLVWNLAGGYQIGPGTTEAQKREPILALHRETARLHTAILG